MHTDDQNNRNKCRFRAFLGAFFDPARFLCFPFFPLAISDSFPLSGKVFAVGRRTNLHPNSDKGNNSCCKLEMYYSSRSEGPWYRKGVRSVGWKVLCCKDMAFTKFENTVTPQCVRQPQISLRSSSTRPHGCLLHADRKRKKPGDCMGMRTHPCCVCVCAWVGDD